MLIIKTLYKLFVCTSSSAARTPPAAAQLQSSCCLQSFDIAMPSVVDKNRQEVTS